MWRLKAQVADLLDQDYELVCVDESCFTWRGYQHREWAPKHENFELYQFAGGPRIQCIAVCGAVSLRGKELFVPRVKSFDGAAYLAFVQQLHAKMGGRKYFLQCDQCRIHTTRNVLHWAASQGVPIVLGVAYCPWFQGIECFWGSVKRAFRQLGTKRLLAFE